MKTMTEAEWRAEGARLFGDDMMKWRFRCPICGHVAAVDDFRKYKDKGANPSAATQECIGRYYPKNKCVKAFGEDDEKPNPKIKQPCDYAGWGLLRVSPVEVEFPDGKKVHSFAFDGTEEGAKTS